MWEIEHDINFRMQRIRQGDALSMLLPNAFWIHGADGTSDRSMWSYLLMFVLKIATLATLFSASYPRRPTRRLWRSRHRLATSVLTCMCITLSTRQVGGLTVCCCSSSADSVCLSGGLSPSMTLQKFGRGLRKAPDKDYLDYHDFFHTTNDYLTSTPFEHRRNEILTPLCRSF